MKAKMSRKKEKKSGKDFLNVKTKPLKSKIIAKKLKKKELNAKQSKHRKKLALDAETIADAKTVDRQKTTEVPKIRRTAITEQAEENFIIVPWASGEEWNDVCVQFHEKNYKDVVAKIGVWQSRVPSLPVGVEATLFLLEAFIYDGQLINSDKKYLYTEDQARSLYSFAIIRYLNHVSQLATQSLGKSSQRLSRELAAIVDTPEWLVALRNNVSHAPTAPSIEALRVGGDYVLQWLKEKYWKFPDKISPSVISSDPFTITTRDEVISYSQLSELFAAFIAAKIYKLRRYRTINDPDVIRSMSNGSTSVKPKVAIMDLKTTLRRFILSHPSLFCTVASQELIPDPEFYEDFKVLLKLNDEDADDTAFNKLYILWMPIVKLLESKGKLISILNNLAAIVINTEFEKMWGVTARWIDKLLEIIETSGKKCSKHLATILEVVIKHPNYSMHHFLNRLFRLTEPRLGSEAVQKLAYLAAIWIEDQSETRKIRKRAKSNLFTMKDIEETETSTCQATEIDLQLNNEHDDNGSIVWVADDRGENFWRNLPLGVIL